MPFVLRYYYWAANTRAHIYLRSIVFTYGSQRALHEALAVKIYPFNLSCSPAASITILNHQLIIKCSVVYKQSEKR